jgi:hypothetical protein
MDFRRIDTNSLKYTYPDWGDKSHKWEMCDKSDDDYISLKTSEGRNIDIYKITIQIIKEPKLQMRIAAEIWDLKLRNKMLAAGFKDYTVPFASGRGVRDKTEEIDVESYCDFSEDVVSQKKAKLFLSSLVKYSHKNKNAKLATYPPNREAVATSIDNLAHKYGMKKPNFGSDWSDNIITNIMKFFSSSHQTRAITNNSSTATPSTR